MPLWTGQFKGKQPFIRLLVAGTRGNPEEFDVVVDTGFGGFLMMGADRAAMHGFLPGPSQVATMADGRRQDLRTAIAMAVAGLHKQRLIPAAAH